MKVVVLIDGRQAVPVRAIPFVTGWNLSPDALAQDLDRHAGHVEHMHALRAFQFDPEDGHPPITPHEWEQVSVGLAALDLRLRRAAGGERDILSYQRWREESAACLPKACFVWRDEFEAAYGAGYTSAASDSNDDLPPLNFSPLIPTELHPVVMEGFPMEREKAAVTPVAGRWPWGSHETKLLRDLAEAAERFWVRYDPSDVTTAPKNEDVVAWLAAKGVSNNVAQVIATILRADGIPMGPRK